MTATYLQSDRKRVEERRQVGQLLRPGTRFCRGPFVYASGLPIV